MQKKEKVLPTNILKLYNVFKKNISFPKFNICINLLFISPNDLVMWEISGFAVKKMWVKKMHSSS